MAKYEASWESLAQYTVPEWYMDAKFGIFIHWGVYSVPAFGNEWYPRKMYLQGTEEFKHHVETWGPHASFGYKDFIPFFTAEQFDPYQWADLFRRSGARYIVPVAEHHDGFAMYDSDLSRWTAAKMGPKRDIIGDLGLAVRGEGMVYGVSSHRVEHWWFMNGGKAFPSDVQDPNYADFYGPAMPTSENHHDLDARPRPSAAYMEDWLARCCELVDKYQPKVFWFDWWIEQVVMKPYLQRFAAYYYNRAEEWGHGVAINYKFDAYPRDVAVLDIERGQLSQIRPQFWQTDTSIAKNSWGYTEGQDYKTATSIIHDLVDIASKNGALLLNIGPRSDGTIPEPEQQILLEIGEWLRVNGEAVYGTRPWSAFGEGPTQVQQGAFTDTKRTPFTALDVRFAIKGDTLYATLLGWPGEQAIIKSLGAGSPLLQGRIGKIELLGTAGELAFSQGQTALTVDMPSQKPCDHAYVLKVTLE